MRPYYENGSCTIYHGDCREMLPMVVPVDLVLTDPPYGINYHADNARNLVANDDSIKVFADAWPRCIDVLRADRHWYVFASPRMIHEVLPIVGNAKHVICWDKGDAGTVGDLECGFGEAWEAIIYGMKGRRSLNGKRPRTVIRKDWSATRDPLHPTVKPVGLLRQLILMSTDEGELVLDPFMGSGTTLRAAVDCGRRAIGIEIEERYCEIAVSRLAQGILF